MEIKTDNFELDAVDGDDVYTLLFSRGFIKSVKITRFIETDSLKTLLSKIGVKKSRDNQVWIKEIEEDEYIITNKLKKSNFIFLIEEEILIRMIF